MTQYPHRRLISNVSTPPSYVGDSESALLLPWRLEGTIIPSQKKKGDCYVISDGEFESILSSAQRVYLDSRKRSIPPRQRMDFSRRKAQVFSLIPIVQELQLGTFLLLDATDGYSSGEGRECLGQYMGESIHHLRARLEQLFSETSAFLRGGSFKKRLDYFAGRIDEVRDRTVLEVNRFTNTVGEYLPI